MKLKVEGVSELVLEVQDMERAVDFWSNVLGFPIVDQWKYAGGQFVRQGAGEVWATWLYVGGNTRLGLWLPRNLTDEQRGIKSSPISQWKGGLYDEGGVHVHFALYIQPKFFNETIETLKGLGIDILVFQEEWNERSNLYFKDTEENVVEFYTKNMMESYGSESDGDGLE